MLEAPSISLLGGRLIDPRHGLDQITDLHLARGRVLAIGAPPAGFQADEHIQASGKILFPGIIDLCARLREPGQEHKATIASETRAAVAGGITTLFCAPDTDPVLDNPAAVELIRRRGKQAGRCMVLAVGALTQGLTGTALSEMAALRRAGCLAVSNAGRPVENTLVLRRAMEYAATFGLVTFLSPCDAALSDHGCMHEGKVSLYLGLPGIPSAAETVAVAQALALAEHTGARLHFRGLSSAAALRMITRARHENPNITADVAAHQLFLTEQDVMDFNADCHVLPPLRSDSDRDALRQAVADGRIQAICSDHQPHEADAKLRPFPSTEPGISALETLLPLTLRLVEENVLSLPAAIARLTSGPAGVLNLDRGHLGPGASADLCVLDPDRYWYLDRKRLHSRGQNTPFDGWDFKGLITHTLVSGRIVHRADT